MTTLMPIQTPCPLCGQIGEQMEIASTTTFGAPDLDLRPAELLRSTLPCWIVRCDGCGYVRQPDGDSEPIPDRAAAQTLVNSQEYRDQLQSGDFPALANDFLCRARIAENAELLDEAGSSALHAAWACDDEGQEQPAVACRSRAFELLSQALSAGVEIVEEPGGQWVVLADILRRAGRLEEGRDLCARTLREDLGEPVPGLIEFELQLIERGDRSAHAIDEA